MPRSPRRKWPEYHVSLWFSQQNLWLCSGIEDSSKGSSACASAVQSEAWPATAKPSPRMHWGPGWKKGRVIGVLHCRGRLPLSGHHRLWWSELWFSRSVRTFAWFLYEHEHQTVPLQSGLSFRKEYQNTFDTGNSSFRCSRILSQSSMWLLQSQSKLKLY